MGSAHGHKIERERERERGRGGGGGGIIACACYGQTEDKLLLEYIVASSAGVGQDMVLNRKIVDSSSSLFISLSGAEREHRIHGLDLEMSIVKTAHLSRELVRSTRPTGRNDNSWLSVSCTLSALLTVTGDPSRLKLCFAYCAIFSTLEFSIVVFQNDLAASLAAGVPSGNAKELSRRGWGAGLAYCRESLSRAGSAYAIPLSVVTKILSSLEPIILDLFES